ncbi:MAG: hypothetical protein JW764_09550 [Chlorobiaceae bacterium]|nr:hypothetical protein [Chlorobiaceae bacterium]
MIRESSAVVFFSEVFMDSIRMSHYLSYRSAIVAKDSLIEFLKNGKALDNIFVERLWRNASISRQDIKAGTRYMKAQLVAVYASSTSSLKSPPDGSSEVTPQHQSAP